MEKEVIKRVARHCICAGLAMVMTASYAIFGEREIVEMSENKAYAEEVVEDTDETPRCTTIVSTSSKNKINLRYSEEEDFFARFRTSLTDEELSDKIEQIEKEKEEAEEAKKKASYSSYSLSTSTDGVISSSKFYWNGGCRYNGYYWTYYSTKQNLSWTALFNYIDKKTGGHYFDSEGFCRDGDGYIIIASKYHSNGTVVSTPFGTAGRVWDCCPEGNMDVLTNW